MAYYTSSDGAGLEEGKSVQLRASRGYGFISAKVSDANSDLVMVQGRYGKRYGIWMTETSKGSFIGEKMFPRTAVRVVISSDGKLHVWIKSTSRRKSSTKSTKRTGFNKRRNQDYWSGVQRRGY